jgi:hypothetical protein
MNPKRSSVISWINLTGNQPFTLINPCIKTYRVFLDFTKSGGNPFNESEYTRGTSRKNYILFYDVIDASSIRTHLHWGVPSEGEPERAILLSSSHDYPSG